MSRPELNEEKLQKKSDLQVDYFHKAFGLSFGI